MLSSAPYLNHHDTFIGNYKGSIVGGQGNSNQMNIYTNHGLGPTFDRLCQHVADDAFLNSAERFARPKCHPQTRTAILENLANWVADVEHKYPILWLYGAAGSGKTAIAHTVADLLFRKNLLLASYFYFGLNDGQTSIERFIATLAYQLVLSIPATRPFVMRAIEGDPLIFSASLRAQAQALIVAPILAAHEGPSFDNDQRPRILVIDGLDECHDPYKSSEILQVLSQISRNLPFQLAVLIASRPEHHIRAAFDLDDLNRTSTRLSLDDNSSDANRDIEIFLNAQFREIREAHPFRRYLPTPWPSREEINTLITKASGQFIYASTVDKFVSSARNNPAKQLDVLLGQSNRGATSPFEQLDTLYSRILSAVRSADLDGTLHLLGVLFCLPVATGIWLKPSRHSPRFLERLLGLDTGEVRHLLFDLESLLTVGPDDEDIRFFHSTLSDYLLDKSRSDQFWIDAGAVYAELAQKCLPAYLKFWQWDGVPYLDLHHIQLFFSKATPTDTLHDAIKNCHISQVISNESTFDDRRYLYWPALLLAISKSTFPDAEQLYMEKLVDCEKYIQPAVDFYFRDAALKNFLIFAAFAGLGNADHKRLMHMFSLTELAFEIDRVHGFRLTSFLHPGFLQILKHLFEDPKSRYFVDKNQFANIALHVMDCMTEGSKCYVTNDIPKIDDSKNIEKCIAEAFPILLSRAAIRQDLVTRIKKLPLSDVYLRYGSINDAITAYLWRSKWWRRLFHLTGR